MGNQLSTPIPPPSRMPSMPRVTRGRSYLPRWLRKKDTGTVQFWDQSHPIFTEFADEARGTSEHVERAHFQAPLHIEIGTPALPLRKKGLLERSADKIKAGLHSVKKRRHQKLADSPNITTTTTHELPGRSSDIERQRYNLHGVATIDWARQAARDGGNGKEGSQTPERRRSRDQDDSSDEGSRANQARDDADNASQSSGRPLLTQLSLQDKQTEQAGSQKAIKYHYKWPYELKRPDAPDDEESFELQLNDYRKNQEKEERRRLKRDAFKLPEVHRGPELGLDFGPDEGEASAAHLKWSEQREASSEENDQISEDKIQGEADGQKAGRKEPEQKGPDQKEPDQKETGQKEIDQKDPASDVVKVSTVNVDELDPEHGLKPAKQLPTGASKTGTSV